LIGQKEKKKKGGKGRREGGTDCNQFIYLLICLTMALLQRGKEGERGKEKELPSLFHLHQSFFHPCPPLITVGKRGNREYERDREKKKKGRERKENLLFTIFKPFVFLWAPVEEVETFRPGRGKKKREKKKKIGKAWP